MTLKTKVSTVLLAVMLPVAAQELNNTDREEFLRSARIVSQTALSTGVTNSSKAQMVGGTWAHAAHIQTVDVYMSKFESTRGVEMNFRDSYRYNIAAYELAKLLQLDMVPPSVERKVGRTPAAVTWWVDNVAMTELDRKKKKLESPDPQDWNRQMFNVRVFDQLIYNTDRNLGNLVITKDWRLWMIDHTRAFRLQKECPAMQNLVQIDRQLLANLRQLKKEDVVAHLGGILTHWETDGLMARRDVIVKFFDQRIAQLGEAAVLHDSHRMSQ